MITLLTLLFSFSLHAGTVELADIRQHHNCGLLYVTSPQMPLSVVGIKEVKKFSRENQFPLNFANDPYSGPSRFPTLNDENLFQLGVLNHFPTYVFYTQESQMIVPGFETSEGLVIFYQKFISTIGGNCQ